MTTGASTGQERERGRQATYILGPGKQVETIWEGLTIIQAGNTQRSAVKVSATKGEVSFKIKQEIQKQPYGFAGNALL